MNKVATPVQNDRCAIKQPISGELDRLYERECQRKSDLNEHLPILRALATECRHITEFGVGGVVSTYALLVARPEKFRGYDLQSHPNWESTTALARDSGIDAEFVEADVREVVIELTDFLFIDTWHRHEQLTVELARHAPRVRKYIALHDTITFGWRGSGGGNGSGLQSAIHEFLYANPDWQLAASYPNNHGLTVLSRKQQTNRRSNGSRTMGIGVYRNREILSAGEFLADSGVQFVGNPTVGVVVGTYAAVPYVHLQLEARRRFYPDVPMLVHDDASHQWRKLASLCREYGADFERNASRRSHAIGDLTAFLGGLHWARERGVDVLAKFSRRFLPLRDWTHELQVLALETQASTFSTWTRAFGFGFRTECMAMAVEAYQRQDVPREIARCIEKNHCSLVEAFMHEMSRRVAESDCVAAKEYKARCGARPREIDTYAVWPFMGFCRKTKYPQFLWHDSSGPEDYHAIGVEWGLDYPLQAYVDPNR